MYGLNVRVLYYFVHTIVYIYVILLYYSIYTYMFRIYDFGSIYGGGGVGKYSQATTTDNF